MYDASPKERPKVHVLLTRKLTANELCWATKLLQLVPNSLLAQASVKNHENIQAADV